MCKKYNILLKSARSNFLAQQWIYATASKASKTPLRLSSINACISSKSLVDFRVAAFTVVRATLPTILAGARPASIMGRRREARGNI